MDRRKKSDRTADEQGNEAPPVQRTPDELVSLVREHLDALNWSQATLATRAGVSTAQVSGWIGKRDRGISRDDVCKLTWAIAGGYDGVIIVPDARDSDGPDRDDPRRPRVEKGRGALEGLLSAMLHAAGYRLQDRPETNRIWSRFARPEDSVETLRDSRDPHTLRVGWFEWEPLAYSEEPPLGFAGIGQEIAARVADLLDLRLEARPLPLSAIRREIHTYRVDLLAPLLHLPSRERSFCFSEAIPQISVGINGLFHVDAKVQIPPEARRLPFDRLSRHARIHYVDGAVSPGLLPGFRGFDAPDPRRWKQGSDAIDYLTAHPFDAGGLPNCFVADDLTCTNHRHNGSLLLLDASPDRHLRTEGLIRLPVAFAAHVNEPRLIQAVNSCLAIMEKSGYVQAVIEKYRAAHAEQLKCLGIADPATSSGSAGKPPTRSRK